MLFIHLFVNMEYMLFIYLFIDMVYMLFIYLLVLTWCMCLWIVSICVRSAACRPLFVCLFVLLMYLSINMVYMLFIDLLISMVCMLLIYLFIDMVCTLFIYLFIDMVYMLCIADVDLRIDVCFEGYVFFVVLRSRISKTSRIRIISPVLYVFDRLLVDRGADAVGRRGGGHREGDLVTMIEIIAIVILILLTITKYVIYIYI